MKTKLTIEKDKFLINGKLIYSEIETAKPEVHGLLMNARFIQGIFDDKRDPSRFVRFGKNSWNPDENTADLIKALPEWYSYGLRGFTVGFQGGGPCFTIDNRAIDNNPFSKDGKSIDPVALTRMKSIIEAADELGMIVIVSNFYSGQIGHLYNDEAVIEAIKLTSNWLRDNTFTNVIIEIANEKDCEEYRVYPSIFTGEGLCKLIKVAQVESGGIPVGCSSLGFMYDDLVGYASDINIIHGNNLTRQRFYNKIIHAQKTGKPILCNEDSQALSQMDVTFDTGVSWGYYNNLTKQEPPTNWGITKGEDFFFAYRMAEHLGIPVPKLEKKDQYYLQGLEKDITYQGKRWIRVASLYPTTIDRVIFYKNNEQIYIAYDDPFLLYFTKNWDQNGIDDVAGTKYKAVVKLISGEEIVLEGIS